MNIGDKIKQARKAAGLTQKELADKLKISYVGVSQWENGLRKPKIETLERIADALDILLVDLLDDDSAKAYQSGFISGAVAEWAESRLKVKDRLKNWQSNKAGRLYMSIDSALLDLLDQFAEEDGLSLEDEVEKILYGEAEQRIEDTGLPEIKKSPQPE